MRADIFGVSEWELFYTLTTGATLVVRRARLTLSLRVHSSYTLTTGAVHSHHGSHAQVMPDVVVRSPPHFSRALVRHKVTVAFLIPSHVDALLPRLQASEIDG